MKKLFLILLIILCNGFLYSQESKWIDSTEFKELSYKVPKLLQWRISDDNKELWIIDSTYKFFKFNISTGAILDTFRFNKDGKKIDISRNMIYYYVANANTFQKIPIKIYSIFSDNLEIIDTLKYTIKTPNYSTFSDFDLKLDIDNNYNIKLILSYTDQWHNMGSTITDYDGRYMFYIWKGNSFEFDTNSSPKLASDCTFFQDLDYNIITYNFIQSVSGSSNSYQGGQFVDIYKNLNLLNSRTISRSTSHKINSPKISFDKNWISIYSNDSFLITSNTNNFIFYLKNIKNLLKIYPFYNNLNSNYNNYFLTHFYDDFGKSKIIAWRYDNDFILNEKEILNYFPKKSISYFGTKSSLLFSDDYGTVRVYKFDDVKESDTKINPPKSLIYRLSDTVKLSGTTSANTPEIVWDYGDGTNDSNKLSVNHIFKKTGIFLVKLSAKDQNGISFDTISIKIIKDLVPKYDFEFLSSGDTSKVQFHNQSEGDIQKYEWDFADGEKSNEIEPIHNYFKKGNYLVKLTATDEIGLNTFYHKAYVSIKDFQNFNVDSANFKFITYNESDAWYTTDHVECISAIEVSENLINCFFYAYKKPDGRWPIGRSINLINNKIQNSTINGKFLFNPSNNDYYETDESRTYMSIYTMSNTKSKSKLGVIDIERLIDEKFYEFGLSDEPIFISNYGWYSNCSFLNKVISFNPPSRIKSDSLFYNPFAIGFNKISKEIMLSTMNDSFNLIFNFYNYDSLKLIKSKNYYNNQLLEIIGGCSLNDGFYFVGLIKRDLNSTPAILHFDFDGNLLNIAFDENLYKLGNILRKTGDSSFVFTGKDKNNIINFNIYKIGSNIQVYNLSKSNSIDNVKSINKGIKNSIIIAGNKGNYTNIVFKINFDDYNFPLGFEESKPKSNSTTNLNYPNPFNQSTQFEFNSDTSGQYNMKIIDYLGVELFNETGIAIEGKNTISFNRKGLSPGVYFCKIVCGNQYFNYKFMISE